MRMPANSLLAISTLVAALFVAVQAWYARVAFVEASRTRLLEDKLDLCFENFDAAVALDTELRAAAPGAGLDDEWPPRIVVRDVDTLMNVQRNVVPALNRLEASLSKASILGTLDKHRGYLADRVQGLSKSLLDINASRIGQADMDAEIDRVFKRLSDFIGAQYLVFTGCRSVADGE